MKQLILIMMLLTKLLAAANVVVAVIDTGIDYTHPDLKHCLWTNVGEFGPWQGRSGDCRDKSCNGLDDDGNGYIDDVIGWDFVEDDAIPYDELGHGTHVAGIIGCKSAPLMILKYYNGNVQDESNVSRTIRAIDYAIRMGANIINYSSSGNIPVRAEYIAIKRAEAAGLLFITAAGNSGQDTNYHPSYPSTYPISNIISVAALDHLGRLLPTSNYGLRISVAAPGLNILSTYPNKMIKTQTGTSMATAAVTRLAALLASRAIGFDYKQIKNLILSGATPMAGVSAGRISTERSLQLQAGK